jgi:hypothetical protein
MCNNNGTGLWKLVQSFNVLATFNEPVQLGGEISKAIGYETHHP